MMKFKGSYKTVRYTLFPISKRILISLFRHEKKTFKKVVPYITYLLYC